MTRKAALLFSPTSHRKTGEWDIARAAMVELLPSESRTWITSGEEELARAAGAWLEDMRRADAHIVFGPNTDVKDRWWSWVDSEVVLLSSPTGWWTTRERISEMVWLADEVFAFPTLPEELALTHDDPVWSGVRQARRLGKSVAYRVVRPWDSQSLLGKRSVVEVALPA